MRKGFTLIELLIVIAIIGLLATLAIVSLTSAQEKARDTRRISDLKQIQNALELYYSENGGAYPTGNAAWADFQTDLASYLTVPQDPTNDSDNYYAYATNADGSSYIIGATLENTGNDALDADYDTDNTIAATTYDEVIPSSATMNVDTLVVAAAGVANTEDGTYCNDTTVPGAYCIVQQ